MKDLNFIAVAFSFATCAISIFQSVYATRHPSKGSKMSVFRSILASVSIVLTVCGLVAVFTLGPLWAIASAVGLVCGIADRRLAKFDWNPEEKELVDRFFALDVQEQKLIFQAVEQNKRVVVCEAFEHKVSLDASEPFKVKPLRVREIAAQGWLAKYDVNVGVDRSGNVRNFKISKIEFYTVLDKARKVVAVVKERGLTIQDDENG